MGGDNRKTFSRFKKKRQRERGGERCGKRNDAKFSIREELVQKETFLASISVEKKKRYCKRKKKEAKLSSSYSNQRKERRNKSSIEENHAKS